MMHDHPVAGAGHNQRCALCTSTDEQGLIERLAADLWESRDDRPWAECGTSWQHIFRQFAETAIDSLRRQQ